MKISVLDLVMCYQTLLDSIKIEDKGMIFKFTRESREAAILRINSRLSEQTIEIPIESAVFDLVK